MKRKENEKCGALCDDCRGAERAQGILRAPPDLRNGVGCGAGGWVSARAEGGPIAPPRDGDRAKRRAQRRHRKPRKSRARAAALYNFSALDFAETKRIAARACRLFLEGDCAALSEDAEEIEAE